jgi:hypothetical protein
VRSKSNGYGADSVNSSWDSIKAWVIGPSIFEDSEKGEKKTSMIQNPGKKKLLIVVESWMIQKRSTAIPIHSCESPQVRAQRGER